MTYRLDNAEERAAASPDFRIPNDAVRRNLKAGDLAKLIFLPGERMWVLIEGRSDTGGYIGTLNNHPVDPVAAGIDFGELVQFGPQHVCGVDVPMVGWTEATPTVVARLASSAVRQLVSSVRPAEPVGLPGPDELQETLRRVGRLYQTTWVKWHALKWHGAESKTPMVCSACAARAPDPLETDNSEE